MKKFLYQLKSLCKANKNGSYATQQKRHEVLQLAGKQLIYDLKYPHMRVTGLKPKHVAALVTLWQSQGISAGTIKSRMSHIRWWAKKIGKPNVVASRNDVYGIGKRTLVATASKACTVEQEHLDKIKDNYIIASLRLAKEFGLRRAESIKCIPSDADKGDHIKLKASWCKGGRARTVPIRTQAQRAALDYAKQVAGSGSLIPKDKQYHQQRNRYTNKTHQAGLRKLHGQRFRYAENRYKELTGWDCPTKGGLKRSLLTSEQKPIDQQARLIISREFGHNRIEIAASYIG